MPNKYQQLLNKILKTSELEMLLNKWKVSNKTVAFTNGCFDILHRGHVEYLTKAADFADFLVVGLNSDASVARLKGENRPVISEQERAFLLAGLSCTTAIVIFEEDTPLQLIEFIKPQILVKGADYKPEEIVGFDIVTACGGSVKTVELTQGCSTTNIIEKIKAIVK